MGEGGFNAGIGGYRKGWKMTPWEIFAAPFGETELSSPLEEVSYSVPNFEN